MHHNPYIRRLYLYEARLSVGQTVQPDRYRAEGLQKRWNPLEGHVTIGIVTTWTGGSLSATERELGHNRGFAIQVKHLFIGTRTPPTGREPCQHAHIVHNPAGSSSACICTSRLHLQNSFHNCNSCKLSNVRAAQLPRPVIGQILAAEFRIFGAVRLQSCAPSADRVQLHLDALAKYRRSARLSQSSMLTNPASTHSSASCGQVHK